MVNEDLEKEFDAFKADLRDDAYLSENKLISFWYKKTYNSTCRIVEKFNKRFTVRAPDEMDALYVWISEKETHEMIMWQDSHYKIRIMNMHWRYNNF